MLLKRVAIPGLLACFIPVTSTLADAYAERALLARIDHELTALEPLIVQASAQADPDARFLFDYGALRQALDEIRLEIDAHIDAPRQQPRTIPPLRGDHRR